MAVPHDEQLDRQDADVLERFQHLASDALRLRRRLRTDPRRRAGAGQDVALVLVLAQVVSDDLAFEAAGGDDLDLALEGDEALEDHRRGPQRTMNRGDVGAFRISDWPLPS